MGYSRVKHFEASLHIHAYRYFSEQVAVFDEMMELYLEPLDEIGSRRRKGREGKHAAVVLLARMFNDFECSRLLLLYGQPEQASMPLRDVVECMMLVRLFLRDPDRALRWMKYLKEYHPADVSKRLGELGEKCPEYAFYGPLSQLAHANLLSVASRVSEEKVGEGLFLETYHFGGVNNPSWIRLLFNFALLLLWMALASVVASVYWPDMRSPSEWWDKLGVLRERLVEFEGVEESSGDRAERERVYKKIGLAKVRAILFDKDVVASDGGFPGLG